MKHTDWLFFSELQGPSLIIINLAQLASPSVALPAELVIALQLTYFIVKERIDKMVFPCI